MDIWKQSCNEVLPQLELYYYRKHPQHLGNKPLQMFGAIIRANSWSRNPVLCVVSARVMQTLTGCGRGTQVDPGGTAGARWETEVTPQGTPERS